MREPDAKVDALLRVSRLQGWYGESHVLHGVDFTVGKGELVTLVGRNGAGKTTILRAIIGLLERREGSIVMNGRELIGLPPNRSQARASAIARRSAESSRHSRSRKISYCRHS